jgi:molybdate transport system regulatory protein
MKHNAPRPRRPGGTGAWIARPRWRLTRGAVTALGPGKADLLEAIGRAGSISAAARLLGMSYRRAWVLADTMNRAFRAPLVAASSFRAGGAGLTDEGREVLRIYRRLEARSRAAAAPLVRALLRRLRPRPPAG